jgi:hypothetical protein
LLAVFVLAAGAAYGGPVVQANPPCVGPLAQVFSPAAGSTLPSGAVTFDWCQANGDYFLDIESVPGAHDIFFAFVPAQEFITLGPGCAPSVPTGCIVPAGETIFLTLSTNISTSGRADYQPAPTLTFTAAAANQPALVPEPGTILLVMAATLLIGVLKISKGRNRLVRR